MAFTECDFSKMEGGDMSSLTQEYRAKSRIKQCYLPRELTNNKYGFHLFKKHMQNYLGTIMQMLLSVDIRQYRLSILGYDWFTDLKDKAA